MSHPYNYLRVQASCPRAGCYGAFSLFERGLISAFSPIATGAACQLALTYCFEVSLTSEAIFLLLAG